MLWTLPLDVSHAKKVVGPDVAALIPAAAPNASVVAATAASGMAIIRFMWPPSLNTPLRPTRVALLEVRARMFVRQRYHRGRRFALSEPSTSSRCYVAPRPVVAMHGAPVAFAATIHD